MNLFDNFSKINVNKLFLDVKNAEVSEKTGPEAVERLEKVEHESYFQQFHRVSTITTKTGFVSPQ